MTYQPANDWLLYNTVQFSRALRERGLLATPSEAIDAATALGLIDLDDREETFLSLRSVLTSRPEDFPVQPVVSCGFKLMPSGFFDRNPMIDLPPTRNEASCCM